MTSRILISGASGLVGSAFAASALARGDTTSTLVRSKSQDGVLFDIPGQEIGDVSGFDVVVHLAGESIASGRWNAARKARIRDSRVAGTELLTKALAKAEQKPRVLICASAIGVYGSRGDEVLTESSPRGEGFLADVGVEWEAAADAAREAGIRVVHMRFGIILSKDGGALKAMLTPFKFGLGGRVGDGHQFWSWITLEDVIRAMWFAIETDSLDGAINTVSPEPATNRQFTRALGGALGRPTILPLPAFAARLVLGEMADHLLLGSARVLPKRLQENGFEFRSTNLDDALETVLGTTS